MEKEEIANQFLFSESSLSFFLFSLLSLSLSLNSTFVRFTIAGYAASRLQGGKSFRFFCIHVLDTLRLRSEIPHVHLWHGASEAGLGLPVCSLFPVPSGNAESFASAHTPLGFGAKIKSNSRRRLRGLQREEKRSEKLLSTTQTRVNGRASECEHGTTYYT